MGLGLGLGLGSGSGSGVGSGSGLGSGLVVRVRLRVAAYTVLRWAMRRKRSTRSGRWTHRASAMCTSLIASSA